MIEQLKLLSMTALLTALIWIAADRLVTEEVGIPVTFRITSAGPSSDMLVAPASDRSTYQLRVVGPRKAVAALEAAAPLAIRLQVPPPEADFTFGPLTLQLRDLLKEQWAVEYPSIAVLGVTPSQMTVNFDRMVQRDVSVTVQRLSLAYDVRPQPQPSSVKVRLRASVLSEIAQGDQLPALDVSTDAEKLLREQPAGQSATVLVTLDPKPFGPDATLTPRSVEIRGTVTAQRTTAEVPTVPVLLAVSFANLGRPLRAVTREGGELVTQTIKVTGPTEDVGRLLRGETRAYGILQLKDEHFAELDVFRPLTPEFQLPPGVELAERPAPVEIKLIDPSRERPQPDGKTTP